jgi:hypothetical protein
VARWSISTTVEIDVGDYWDAVALLELLIPFNPFLVQHTTEHWVVHARAPGGHGESLADALDLIDEWQAKMGVNGSVHVVGQSTSAGDGHIGHYGGRKPKPRSSHGRSTQTCV